MSLEDDFWPKYTDKLYEVLPMRSADFLNVLGSHQLLPEKTREKIQTEKTTKEGVDYFIQHVIKSSPDLHLPNLLQAMEQYHKIHTDSDIMNLVIDMRKSWNGMYV